MDRKEMDDSTGSRRLLPPLYPYSRSRTTTTTTVPRGTSSAHQLYSRPHPYQQNPAAAAAHFSSQVSPGTRAYQLPPSYATHASAGGASLHNTMSRGIAYGSGCAAAGSSSNQLPPSYATHASAGGANLDHTMSRGIAYGSGCAPAGSSSYQWPPSLLPQIQSSDGRSVVDGGSAACDASQQVALLGVGSSCYQMPPPSTPALDPAGTLGGGLGGSGSSSTTMPRYDTFHSSHDNGLQVDASMVGLLPPLSSFNNNLLLASLSPSPSPTPLLTEGAASAGLTQEKYNLPPLPPSLGGPPPPQTASGSNVAQFVDFDGLCGGLNNSGSPCPPLASPSLPLPVPAVSAPANTLVNWSSWGTSQLLGNNTIPSSSSSSSSMWMPQPYPSAVASSNSLPAPEPNNGVKEEDVDWSSRLGKNTITTGAGSSASMPQPTHPSVMVAGSKKKLSSSSGAPAGSGIHCKNHNGDPMFNEDDIHKILADKGLKDLVQKDPKRVRGILNNRRNSSKSSKKKKAYLSNLEHKVKQLQQQKNSLSAEVISLQSTTISLIAEKNEMMTKLHVFEQQAQLANAQNETLKAEIHRLKLAAGETMGSHVTSNSYQGTSSQMMQ